MPNAYVDRSLLFSVRLGHLGYLKAQNRISVRRSVQVVWWKRRQVDRPTLKLCMLRGLFLQVSRVSRPLLQSYHSQSRLYQFTMAASGATAIAFATVTAPKSSEMPNTAEHDADDSKSTRPAHHLNDNKNLFTNPWPSHRYVPRSTSPSGILFWAT